MKPNYDKIDDTDTRASTGGVGAKPLQSARFREHCFKVPHSGCGGKAPARVSEQCYLPG